MRLHLPLERSDLPLELLRALLLSGSLLAGGLPDAPRTSVSTASVIYTLCRQYWGVATESSQCPSASEYSTLQGGCTQSEM
jgi:hypothetical protein